jgi:hypothetical protein
VRFAAVAAAGLLVTLALGACSVGSKHSSSATAAGTGTSAAGAGTGTSTAGTGTGASAGATGTSSATSTSAVTSVTSSTSGAQPGHSRGKHGGNDLPAAPAGLAQTTGYGSYEGCQGTCTGAVPAALRRPLKLPSADGGPCPITIQAQPASPRVLPAGLGFHSVSGSQWLTAEVTWNVPGSYTGPLLIRGALIGGGPLGFGTGAVPYDELQLLDAGQGAPRVAGGGRAWITHSRVRAGGCYAYQVDGTSFSETVVFRAVA